MLNFKKIFFIISLISVVNFTYASTDKIRGNITKLTISNENNQEPGFNICVKDKMQEVCMWRRYNSFNYQQLLDIANMAMIANKQVEITANIMGALDGITVFN